MLSDGAGDTTLNLLWRMQNGEGPAFSPKVAVVLIGTNDLTNPIYALVTIPYRPVQRHSSKSPFWYVPKGAALHAVLWVCVQDLSKSLWHTEDKQPN